MNAKSVAHRIVDDLSLDASLPVRLEGSFETSEGVTDYKGTLSVGDASFDLSMSNFNTGLPILQTARDINGLGMSLNLLDYVHDKEKPIGLTVQGDHVVISRADQPEALLLMLLGRHITNNTP